MTGHAHDPLSTQELVSPLKRDRSRMWILSSFALSAAVGAAVFALVGSKEEPRPAAPPPPVVTPVEKTVEAPPPEEITPPAPAPEPPKVTRPRRTMMKSPAYEPEREEHVSRPIAPEAIRGVIAKREADVSSCHMLVAGHGRRTPPRVDLALTIEPTGYVSSARVDPPKPDRLATCLAVKTKTWRFPADPNRERQEVKVPLVLVSARG